MMAAGSAGAKRSSGLCWGAAVAWMAVIGAWYLRRPEGPLAIAAAIAMIAPALLNFAWIPIGTEGRSLQDYAGHLRVVRTN
jgi:hypothetical protein